MAIVQNGRMSFRHLWVAFLLTSSAEHGIVVLLDTLAWYGIVVLLD